MHILMVGVNFRTAPIEIREKLTFHQDKLIDAIQKLNQQKSVLENVIISTCNRTELYAVVDQLHTGRYYLKQFLANWFGMEKDVFSSHLVIYENDGAKEHLFRVTAGLDSMVVGETQILGQVKHAFHLAQSKQATGTVFNQLFKQAVTLAKRAHKETGISDHPVSISYAAVSLIKKLFYDMTSKHITILGAGKMGELAAKNLYDSGIETLTVVNRSLEKAQVLAQQFNGQALTTAQLSQTLLETDIFISSTNADHFVLTKHTLGSVMEERKPDRPLVMIDIAVPRDIDPEIASMDNIYLYDIDDLQDVVDNNISQRKQASDKIELMIEGEIVAFNQWLNRLGVVPIISSLREHALTIQAETMDSIERKIPDLTDRERKVISKHTKSIINQLLKKPVSEAKELAVEPHATEALALFVKIFGIEDLVNQKIKEQMKQNNVIPLKADSNQSEKVLETVATH
ncbi:glutamyl-tRNA reductase [Paraliobacillus sp. JSM ZJ581]|uniref:glutamyl-tRNA reductase n=1 Tax=Paraliobacillus sp. JSM ZJ581 TaxID=3342118 RepID=UPI0035A84544